MISGKQIRAARMLVEWDAEDLAVQTGLTRETIFNIERGVFRPRVATLEKIVRAFSDHRIEFLDNQGVRFRPEDVEVLNGAYGIEKFSDLIFAFAKTTGGVIRQIGIEETSFEKYAPVVAAAHRKRMLELVRAVKNVQVRAILKHGDKNFENSDYAEFKWFPQNIPSPIPYYVFGDTVCIFAFDADPPPKIILITSPAISKTYAAQFDEIWSLANHAHK